MQNNNLRTTNTATSTINRQPFLEIKDVCKIYPTKNGPFTVLDGVNLNVEKGEFICVIGHSGCGKSTLLNMVSGFNFPTTGQVLLEGEAITKPGPDRMVVFQNYALLPWRTAFDNIYLSVNAFYPTKPQAEKRAIVREHLTIVGDGNQRIDFTYVGDVCQANILAATTEVDFDSFGQVYNVGTGNNYSVNQIARMISDNTVNITPRPGEARISLANNQKLIKTFGWKSSMKLEDWINGQE